MTHAIFGQRFLGRREPAWHGLGTTFPADAEMSPAEGILRVNGDYHVQKLPLVVHLPDGVTLASDKVAIVRYPTHDDGSYHVLGYAGPDYEVVQNIELGFMLEDLAKEWPLETVGVLNQGRDIFITLDAGSAGVGGEEIRQYFLLANSHTGGKSLKVALTPVRVVCQNTLIAGTSAASIISALPHTINLRAEVNFRIDLIANMRRSQLRLLESFEAMARFKVDADQAKEIITAAYPMPKPPAKKLLGDVLVNDQAMMQGLGDDKKLALSILTTKNEATAEYEYKIKRVEQFREAAKERVDAINDQFLQIAGTAWATWQGVTETECYRNSDGKDGSTAASQSILFGERGQAMARSYNRAMAIIEANA
jgi:phage/plasmid-like protein (TIGR03299 family)